MTTAIVTELPHVLEPMTRDPFLDGLDSEIAVRGGSAWSSTATRPPGGAVDRMRTNAQTVVNRYVVRAPMVEDAPTGTTIERTAREDVRAA